MKKSILIFSILFIKLISNTYSQNFNYSLSVSQSNYTVLAQNDSILSDSAFWESNAIKLPLGFSFTFGDLSFDEIIVRNTGVLSFDANNSYSIVAFMKNFNLVFDTTNTLLSKVKSGLHTNSVTGNLIFKIEFNEVSYLAVNGKNVTVNFQIWLNQNTNSIEFHFGPSLFEGDSENLTIGLLDLNSNDGIGNGLALSGSSVSPNLITVSGLNTSTLLSNIPISGTVYVFSKN